MSNQPVDPLKLLQTVHARGEQWWSNPDAVDSARQAANQLRLWIIGQLAKSSAEPNVPPAPPLPRVRVD